MLPWHINLTHLYSLQVDHSFDEMPPLPPRLSGPGVELPLTIRYGESLTIRVDVDGKFKFVCDAS